MEITSNRTRRCSSRPARLSHLEHSIGTATRTRKSLALIQCRQHLIVLHCNLLSSFQHHITSQKANGQSTVSHQMSESPKAQLQKTKHLPCCLWSIHESPQAPSIGPDTSDSFLSSPSQTFDSPLNHINQKHMRIGRCRSCRSCILSSR